MKSNNLSLTPGTCIKLESSDLHVGSVVYTHTYAHAHTLNKITTLFTASRRLLLSCAVTLWRRGWTYKGTCVLLAFTLLLDTSQSPIPFRRTGSSVTGGPRGELAGQHAMSRQSGDLRGLTCMCGCSCTVWMQVGRIQVDAGCLWPYSILFIEAGRLAESRTQESHPAWFANSFLGIQSLSAKSWHYRWLPHLPGFYGGSGVPNTPHIGMAFSHWAISLATPFRNVCICMIYMCLICICVWVCAWVKAHSSHSTCVEVRGQSQCQSSLSSLF